MGRITPAPYAKYMNLFAKQAIYRLIYGRGINFIYSIYGFYIDDLFQSAYSIEHASFITIDVLC